MYNGAEYKEIDITDPKNGRRVMRDHWWLCMEGNPQRALFYVWHGGTSPQANTDKRILEGLPYEGATPVFVKVAFAPAR